MELAPRLTPRRPRRSVDDLLGAVGLDGRAKAYPGELSGGELARAGLAVALANDPAVLLADEPTGELDGATEARVLDLLVRPRAAASRYSWPATARRWPRPRTGSWSCGRAGGRREARGCVVSVAGPRRDRTRAASGGVHAASAGPSGAACRGRAVRGVTARVEPGARVALTGPSGSGKSTLLHLLAGLDRADGGLAPNGRPGGPGVPGSEPAAGAGRDRERGVPVAAGRDDRTAVERAAAALDRLELGELAGTLPDELSGGQAQRVAVARVLAGRPALVLADEPTGQLDHDTADRSWTCCWRGGRARRRAGDRHP